MVDVTTTECVAVKKTGKKMVTECVSVEEEREITETKCVPVKKIVKVAVTTGCESTSCAAPACETKTCGAKKGCFTGLFSHVKSFSICK